MQTWERETFTSPPLENKRQQKLAGWVMANTVRQLAYLSKPWRGSTGMIKILKVGPILREWSQGNKNQFISHIVWEQTDESLNILQKNKESRGKPGARYVGVRRNDEFQVRGKLERAPIYQLVEKRAKKGNTRIKRCPDYQSWSHSLRKVCSLFCFPPSIHPNIDIVFVFLFGGNNHADLLGRVVKLSFILKR